MKTTIKNQVTLPPQLFALLEQKAKRRLSIIYGVIKRLGKIKLNSTSEVA